MQRGGVNRRRKERERESGGIKAFIVQLFILVSDFTIINLHLESASNMNEVRKDQLEWMFECVENEHNIICVGRFTK